MLRVITLAGCAAALAPPALSIRSATRLQSTAENVAQTQETSRDKVMTFSYDTERERKYAKPVYKGTGDGLGGEEGEYDVVVIGSGMGGLACGAMCAKYISASRCVETPSRHRRDSCPSDEVVGGFFFDSEAVRTESLRAGMVNPQ
jgi:hypothetical protein